MCVVGGVRASRCLQHFDPVCSNVFLGNKVQVLFGGQKKPNADSLSLRKNVCVANKSFLYKKSTDKVKWRYFLKMHIYFFIYLPVHLLINLFINLRSDWA